MKEQFELRIGPGGTVETIYQDGIAEALGAETVSVKRASLIEWEETPLGPGWTVRAAHNPALAVRWTGPEEVPNPEAFGASGGVHLIKKVSTEGLLAMFPTRELALEYEQKFFWQLLEKE